MVADDPRFPPPRPAHVERQTAVVAVIDDIAAALGTDNYVSAILAEIAALQDRASANGLSAKLNSHAERSAAFAEGVEQGRAEAEQYRAELKSRTVDVGFAEVGEPVVVLRIPLGNARDLQSGLADLLCWIRGYTAAIPDNPDRHPMGVEDGRTLSRALLDGIAKARKVEPLPIF